MGEEVTLDAEFLRRALGQEGEVTNLEVTPGAPPPDFPVLLPPSGDLRVLGGVRSVTRPTFTSGERAADQTLWRLFLDVPGAQPGVMGAFTDHLEGQGWRPGQMWHRAFVEAVAGHWMGVHASQARTLNLHAWGEGGVTQVSLNVQDAGAEQVRHLLGEGLPPHCHPMHQLPLPTLSVPQGWRVQMQGGNGGEAEHDERALLMPPNGETGDPEALLAHFRPQLERQGWRVLHVGREADALYLTARTEQGIGVLTLGPGAGAWQAVLLHMALRPGGGGSVTSFYTLSSEG